MEAVKSTRKLRYALAGVEHLDRLGPLFDAYRVWYGRQSDLPGSEHFLFERLINHESVIFLALDGDNDEGPIAGFAQLYMTFSSLSLEPVWILNDLYVAPEWRRNGVAKALVKQAQQLVIDREDKGLVLETAPDNRAAQALYTSLGFTQDTEFWQFRWNR